MSIRLSLIVSAFALTTLMFVGCDTKKVQEAVTSTVDAAKTSVSQTVEAAKQEINLSGSMEISTAPPIQAKACYAKLIVIGGGYPTTLQLASYKTPELERFPSMFIVAPVKVESLSQLVGQSVKADLYAQTAEGEAVWQTPDGSPATLTISAVDENSLTAHCNSVTLIKQGTDEQTTVNGKFVALFE